jgi:hypothetical protein
LPGGTVHTVIHFNSTTNTTSFTDVSAGTGPYSFTDAKSCGPVTGTVVNQPPVLALTSAAVTAIDCNGGKATVTIVYRRNCSIQLYI